MCGRHPEPVWSFPQIQDKIDTYLFEDLKPYSAQKKKKRTLKYHRRFGSIWLISNTLSQKAYVSDTMTLKSFKDLDKAYLEKQDKVTSRDPITGDQCHPLKLHKGARTYKLTDLGKHFKRERLKSNASNPITP